ncbi:DNA-binding NtrC family response regulator [Desulfobaculum xiamenense]|uniref:DNA-binding NtrC family response regulator n=1 Tax=Desulfobaculum xiamenense TaxID=995050 RepID=A0A846QER1_9BACT|nr:response regulator [Desulfobaculum xiamenense]NJB67246.1 DNA-binding NtrC family response regulator [Desulfobaculum xiamenense]
MADSHIILILDDEQMVRENLEAFFEDEGFEVRTASDGEKGLAIIATGEIALGIIDMRLPGMAGSEFILHAHAKSPHTHFLIHTGSTNFKLPSELKDIGMTSNDVFIKPLADMGVLLAAVESKLGSA